MRRVPLEKLELWIGRRDRRDVWAELANVSTLRELSLYLHDSSPNELAWLSKLTQLSGLSISGITLSPQELADLQRMLPGTKINAYLNPSGATSLTPDDDETAEPDEAMDPGIAPGPDAAAAES